MNKLILVLLSIILLSTSIGLTGCGPTLADTKAQYVLGVDAAATALDWAAMAKKAGKLSVKDVNTISYAVDRFEFYRSQVRTAIDSNIIAPVNVRNGMTAALNEIALIQLTNQGVN